MKCWIRRRIHYTEPMKPAKYIILKTNIYQYLMFNKNNNYNKFDIWFYEREIIPTSL